MNADIPEAPLPPRGPGLGPLHARLIARIALASGLLAAIVLLALIYALTGGSADDYSALVRSHTLTERNLAPAMLVAGLVLLAAAGALVWLAALYTSFRVAGPLYRFARNMEAACRGGEVTGIRRRDCLQQTSRQLAGSARRFRAHYEELRAVAARLEQALAAAEAATPAAAAEIRSAVEELQRLATRVRVGG